MNFDTRIREMVAAVERGDGKAVAACFTSDGIYHDIFYGDFRGAEIANMVSDCFYRDAADFRWDILDAVEQNNMGYARYMFSYLPKGHSAQDGRAMFDGVAICQMRDGLIADYSEIANVVIGLHNMGFTPEWLANFVSKQDKALRARPEAARHLAQSS